MASTTGYYQYAFKDIKDVSQTMYKESILIPIPDLLKTIEALRHELSRVTQVFKLPFLANVKFEVQKGNRGPEKLLS